VLDIDWGGIALLVLYFAITVTAPRILTSPHLISKYPRFLIFVWLDALVTALLTLTVGSGLLIADGLAGYGSTTRSDDWPSSVTQTLLAWAAVAFLGIIIFRLGAGVSAIQGEQREGQRAFSKFLETSASGNVAGRSVKIVDEPSIVVTAIPHTKDIIVSTGFVNSVPERLQRAALLHEQSHISNRHHALLAAAHLAMVAAAGIPASRKFAQAMRISTELAADDDAARTHGASTVADALDACFGDSADVNERSRRLRERSP
jgi:Zn-dependent protease with chaperone function